MSDRPYADWSDDEILRGREHGVKGGKPRLIPKGLHDEAMFRLLTRGRDLFADNFEQAVEVIVGIAKDESADNAIRMKAAQYIVERIAGKTADKIEISAGDKPFEVILRGITRDLTEAEVVEAEVVEPEDGPAEIEAAELVPEEDAESIRSARRKRRLAHRRRLAEANQNWKEGD